MQQGTGSDYPRRITVKTGGGILLPRLVIDAGLIAAAIAGMPMMR